MATNNATPTLGKSDGSTEKDEEAGHPLEDLVASGEVGGNNEPITRLHRAIIMCARKRTSGRFPLSSERSAGTSR